MIARMIRMFKDRIGLINQFQTIYIVCFKALTLMVARGVGVYELALHMPLDVDPLVTTQAWIDKIMASPSRGNYIADRSSDDSMSRIEYFCDVLSPNCAELTERQRDMILSVYSIDMSAMLQHLTSEVLHAVRHFTNVTPEKSELYWSVLFAYPHAMRQEVHVDSVGLRDKYWTVIIPLTFNKDQETTVFLDAKKNEYRLNLTHIGVG